MKLPIRFFICFFVFVTISSNSIAQQCSATAGYQEFNVGGNKNGDSLALPIVDETTDLFINVDGVETKIYLTFLDRTYSYNELASVFNSKIPNITASLVGGNLRIQSNTLGSNSKVILSRFAEEESDFRIYLQGYQGLSVPVSGTGSNTNCTVAPPLAPQLASVPTPSSTIDSGRVLPANFEVNSSGQATYSIPILTGPGSAGFVPEVSLNYNSGGGKGSLGLGWSLNAGGSISRCRQTEGQDKNFAPIMWNQDDRFCLNGERLLVSGGYTYGALNSQYKTEIDSFARITAVGGAVGQPEYFKVERKGGRIDYYGKNEGGTESRHKLASDKILSWPLTHSEDSAGNKIIYTYADDEDTGVQRPITSISYGFDSNGSSAAYRIYFNWEINSEEISGYISGYKYRNIYRLESIESNNLLQPSILRLYKLLYNQDSAETPWDKVSRLVSIQECATVYICGAPTKFDWLLPDTGGFISNLTPLITLNSPYRTHVFGDINGDGLQDLVWIQSGDTTVRYAFANVDSIGRISYSLQNFEGNQIVSANYYVNISPPGLAFIDYNGDGHQDLVIHQHTNPRSIRIFLSKPQMNGGWLLAGTPVETLTVSGSEWTTQFVDLNGDGLEDFVGLETLKYRYLKPGSGFDSERNITVIPPAGTIQGCYTNTIAHPVRRLRPETGDFNGDGRVDFIAAVLVCSASGSARYEYHLYTSHIGAAGNLELRYFDALTDLYADTLLNLWGSSERVAGSFTVVDLNADGLSDVVFSLSQSYFDGVCRENCNLDKGTFLSDGMSRYKFSTGKQLSTETQIGTFDRKLTSFTDFNGDGHPDILIAPPDFIGQSGKTNIRYWNSKTNTFNSTTTTLQMPYAPTVDSVIYQDINGDGAPDYFFIGADAGPRRNELHAMLNNTNNKVSNRITLITNGLGHKTRITYQSLAKTAHYNRIHGVKSNAYENVCVNLDVGQTCWDRQVAFTNSTDFYNFVKNPFNDLSSTEQVLNFPPLSAVFNIAGSAAIVTGTTQDAPEADEYTPGQMDLHATRDTVYYYEQLRAQAAGRGWLGFKKTIKIDGKTGLRNVSVYRQDWPFTGQIRTSETYTQSGHLLDKTENTWGLVNCHDSLGNPNPSCVSNMRTQASAYGTSTLGAIQPFLRKRVIQRYGLKNNGTNQGDLLSTASEINRYDAKGNLQESTSETNSNLPVKGRSKTTTHIYDYSGSTWSMQQGRLQQLVATTSDPVYGSITRTSAFTYYTSGTAIGLLSTETIEPGNPAFTITKSHYYQRGNRYKSVAISNGQSRQNQVQVGYDTRGRYIDYTYNYGTDGIDPDLPLLRVDIAVTQRDKYGTPIEERHYTDHDSFIVKKTATTAFGTPFFMADSTGVAVEISMGLGMDTYGICPGDTKTWSISQSISGGKSIQCSDILGRTRRAGSIGFDGVNWSLTDIEYDKFSRIVRTTAPYWQNSSERYWTTNIYDVLGRVTEIKSPYKNGHASTYIAYSNLDTQITNPKLHTRIEKRDLVGQVIEINDPNNGITKFAYDARGNMREMIDPNSNITSIGYDLLDRKISMADPDKGNWIYKYNNFNDLICQMDAKGQTSVQRYDVAGRIFSRTDRSSGGNCDNPTGAVGKYTQWKYDTAENGFGKLASVFDSTAIGGSAQYKQSFTYDGFGRAIGISTSMPGHLGVQSDHYEKITYDQYGRVFQTFDAARTSASFNTNGVQNVYNAQGYFQKAVDAVSYNGVQQTYYTVKTMNARGNITSADYGNGITQTAAYYPETGLTKTLRTNRGLVSLPLQDITLDWDEVGNLDWRHEQGTAGASVRRNIREDFDYDNLNRLRTWISSGDLNVTETANYNNIDNITDKTGVGSYLYGNQCGGSSNAGPHALCRAGTTNYNYDLNGNMLNDSAGRLIKYTSYDLPMEITKANHKTEFSYGPNRTRYKRIDTLPTGQVSTTLYLGSVEKVYYSDGSIQWKRNIAGVGLITQAVNSNGTKLGEAQRYLIKDHLGSLSLITDEIGAVEQSNYFDPWGRERKIITSGSIKQWMADNANYRIVNKPITTRGFTGQEQLAEVGLIHMNGRIYDGALGRFVQADPFIQDPMRIQSLNRYSYVWNNPLNATDPSGFFTKGGIDADETPSKTEDDALEHVLVESKKLSRGQANGIIFTFETGNVSERSFSNYVFSSQGFNVEVDRKIVDKYTGGDIRNLTQEKLGKILLEGATTKNAMAIFSDAALETMGDVGSIEALEGNPFLGALAIAVEQGSMGIVFGNTSILSLRTTPQIEANKTAAMEGRAGKLINAISMVAMVRGGGARNVLKGPLPNAADSIDQTKIREIERRVRSGELSFPLDTGAQLRAVAESFKTKIQHRLGQGKIDAAKNVQRAGNEAIDTLDRFDALTPAARQQLRDIVNSGMKQ